MPIALTVLVVLAAFVLSALLTRSFSIPASPLYILDYPNRRSLHSEPTPRTGGIAIIATIYLCALIVWWWLGGYGSWPGWVAGGGLLVFGISFLDDWFGLAPAYRIIVHIIAATVLAYGGFTLVDVQLPGIAWIVPVYAAIPLTLLFIVWMINLYNFMDGMDGFAGGMTIFGFGTYAVFGAMAGEPLYMLLNLLVAASAAGFLLFNFPPARIFMGDTGSSTLGYLAGGAGLWGIRDGIIPLWLVILVFSPFIIDATVTLLRRVLRRERIWEAHRSHYYQRLVRAGWGHRRTILWEYGVMLACAVTAVWAFSRQDPVQWAILLSWALLYTAFAWIITGIERRGGRITD